MPTTTADQGLTEPVDLDTADNPVAFVNLVGGVEQRLVRRYTDEADRTTRMLTLVENAVSTLATENRAEIYDGTNHISLYSRALYANLRKTSDQNVGPSNTTLANVTDLVAALPTANGAIFGWQAVIFYDAATAADIKFAFTIPTGATMRWGIIGAGTATVGDPAWTTQTASGTATAIGGNGVGTVLMTIIHGELTLGANPGNLQLQAAQNTSDATATTVFTRSRMQVWRSS